MSVNFSSNDKAAIDREVEVPNLIYVENVEEAFEIDRCVEWITSTDLKKVALQFPDYLVSHSPKVAQLIEAKLRQK